MQKFQLLAQVKHTVTDVVTLTVEADSEQEAFSRAKRVLSVFPRAQDEDGIPYCYIEHRVYDDTDVVDIKNMEEQENSA